jgi:hypothetical protein
MTNSDPTPEDSYPDKMDLKLPRQTWRRIDRLLKPGETREEFLRALVARELQQREEERFGQA